MHDTATVVSLMRYPVKGFSGQGVRQAELIKDGYFPGDRLYAIENGPSGYDPAAPSFQPKFKYLVLMRNPVLAAYQTHYDDTNGLFSIARKGEVLAEGQLNTAEGRESIERFLASELKDELRGPPRILPSSASYRFMDSPKSGFVSLLNLPSLRALAAKAGRNEISAERFRMNIVLDGLPPWGEFDLVGKVIRVGTAELEVLKPTERCAATHVSPGHGLRDLDVVGLLERSYGHHNCGIYARVVTSGAVTVGDTLAPLQSPLI